MSYSWNLTELKGGWPTTFLDVGEGVDYLRTLSVQYPLDVSRVVVSGHSAGGHLALWAAARYKLKEGDDLFVSDPLPIQGVAPLAAIPDLETIQDYEIGGSLPIPELMGGTFKSRLLFPLSSLQVLTVKSQTGINKHRRNTLPLCLCLKSLFPECKI